MAKKLLHLSILSLLVAVVFQFGWTAFAQDAAPAAPVFPWEQNAIVVVIVNTILGIAQKVVGKIPGLTGQIIKWLVDVMSANIAHKK